MNGVEKKDGDVRCDLPQQVQEHHPFRLEARRDARCVRSSKMLRNDTFRVAVVRNRSSGARPRPRGVEPDSFGNHGGQPFEKTLSVEEGRRREGRDERWEGTRKLQKDWNGKASHPRVVGTVQAQGHPVLAVRRQQQAEVTVITSAT
jgi:hypothetical protein